LGYIFPDFWTTRCTRCPEALDKLNDAAAAGNGDNENTVQFISVCCDAMDGAREILDRDAEPLWDAMTGHYFMDVVHKERAKKLLGFNQVPFYVVFSEVGEILYTGRTINLTSYLGGGRELCEIPDKVVVPSTPPSDSSKSTTVRQESSASPESVLVIDDLDF
jgi:hypothetical protein